MKSESTLGDIQDFIDYINKKASFSKEKYDLFNDTKPVKKEIGTTNTGDVFIVVETGPFDPTVQKINKNQSIHDIIKEIALSRKHSSNKHGISDEPIHICGDSSFCAPLKREIEKKIIDLKQSADQINQANESKWERYNFVAFYKPMHFYSNSWGIYLDCDELADYANYVLNGVNNNPQRFGQRITLDDAINIVSVFTFFHEMYHHKIEAFSLKLELLYRLPFYSTAFHCLYCKTYGTDMCLEEGFANASSYYQTIDHFGQFYNQFDKNLLRKILRYLMIQNSPPGYNLAYSFVAGNKSDFILLENMFFEILLQDGIKSNTGSFLDDINANSWNLATHITHPYINKENEVTYIIRAGSTSRALFNL
jgi:hypothetical protein